MENVYNFPLNNIINLREQLKKFQDSIKIKEHQDFPENDDQIKNYMQFKGSQQDFQTLVESVSLDTHLKQIDDVRVLDYNPGLLNHRRKSIVEIPKKALRLNTFRQLVKFKENYSDSRRKAFLKTESRHRYLYKGEHIGERNLKPNDDIVITIRVYQPFRHVPGRRKTGPKFSEEFFVLGSQHLTCLKDKISCICNNGPLYDISEDPYKSQPPNTSFSGFFFITDTFYNDMSHPNNMDYSEKIREWAKDKKKRINPLKVLRMEETTFLDLNVRMGYPQVYQHEGNCEHLFTFSFVQLLSPRHNLHRDSYPILNTLAFPQPILCNICGLREFAVIVQDSEEHLHDPSYLCRACFDSYHYIDGKKIGKFKAFNLNPNEILDVIPYEEIEE